MLIVDFYRSAIGAPPLSKFELARAMRAIFQKRGICRQRDRRPLAALDYQDEFTDLGTSVDNL
eukprot:scaffold269774_cov31-Attheya_sp.AAC.1